MGECHISMSSDIVPLYIYKPCRITAIPYFYIMVTSIRRNTDLRDVNNAPEKGSVYILSGSNHLATVFYDKNCIE